jgi:hypothetical protein
MTIVLVEGNSDRVALEVFARRLGFATPTIMAIGGAHAAARVVAGIRATAPHEHIVGLVDAGERRAFTGVIDAIFVCDRDLEDELIRAMGIETALCVIEQQGELGSFGVLQKQPAHRDRNVTDQLRQFLHGRSGNKARYAALFAEALELDRIPVPIREVLAAATDS